MVPCDLAASLNNNPGQERALGRGVRGRGDHPLGLVPATHGPGGVPREEKGAKFESPDVARHDREGPGKRFNSLRFTQA